MMQDFSSHIRQMTLRGWGKKGQEKLAGAKVLVIGAGGLGCGLSLMLASGGVGSITIVDYDKVEAGNLSRQILFCKADLGQPKASVAENFLSSRYPGTIVKSLVQKFDSAAFDSLSGYDFMMDCTDDIPTRYEMEKFSKLKNLPWISGSLHLFQAQISLFNFEFEPGKRSRNYSDYFPETQGKQNAGNCSDNGVAPYFPTLAAQLMAGEFYKAMIGFEKPLLNELLLFDGLTLTMRKLKF